jgi:hypothetical protein
MHTHLPIANNETVTSTLAATATAMYIYDPPNTATLPHAIITVNAANHQFFKAWYIIS